MALFDQVVAVARTRPRAEPPRGPRRPGPTGRPWGTARWPPNNSRERVARPRPDDAWGVRTGLAGPAPGHNGGGPHVRPGPSGRPGDTRRFVMRLATRRPLGRRPAARRPRRRPGLRPASARVRGHAPRTPRCTAGATPSGAPPGGSGRTPCRSTATRCSTRPTRCRGQSGKVWFLGGTFLSTQVAPGEYLGERLDREVTIPAGTALFFPVMNAAAAELEGDGTHGGGTPGQGQVAGRPDRPGLVVPEGRRPPGPGPRTGTTTGCSPRCSRSGRCRTTTCPRTLRVRRAGRERRRTWWPTGTT